MGVTSLAFAIGILACQLGAVLPQQDVTLVACLAAAGLLAGGLLHGRSRRLGRAVALLVLVTAAVGAGWAYAAWRAELRLAEALPGEWEGRDVVLTGVVASLPQDFERGLRFVF